MDPYTLIDDLADALPEPPADSILSRTIYSDDAVKAIVFRFAAGQELSEHTASQPALLHFLDGEAAVTLGEDELTAGPGTWVRMAPRLEHSIVARTPLTMLLLLVQAGAG